MDDLKLLSKNENYLKNEIKILQTIRKDINMNFILETMLETIIVPIHKQWDREKCENYRGIALGNAAYKILSNIILEKMKPYIEENYGRLSEWI
jgi:hypothetical protein